MARVSLKDLEHWLGQVNKMAGTGFRLRGAYGKVGIDTETHRNVTPLMTKREVGLVVDGMIALLDNVKGIQKNPRRRRYR